MSRFDHSTEFVRAVDDLKAALWAIAEPPLLRVVTLLSRLVTRR